MDITLTGIIQRFLPVTPNRDSSADLPLNARFSPYNELITAISSTGRHQLVDEGSYYKLTNPVVGTALAHSLITAFTPASPILLVKNMEKDKYNFLDFIKLITSVVPATASSVQYAVIIDSTDRLAGVAASGTSLTPVNANGGRSTVVPNMIAIWNPTINTSSANAKVQARGVLKGAIPVVQDELILKFSNESQVGQNKGLTVAGSTIGETSPIALSPGDTALIYVWVPGNATTAGSYELEVGGWTR